MEFIDPKENSHAYKYAFTLTIIEHLKVLQKLGSLQMDMKEYSSVPASTVDYMHYLKVTTDYFMPAVAAKHRNDDVSMTSKWGYPTSALSYNLFSLLLGVPQEPISQTTEQLLTEVYNNVDPPCSTWDREAELGDILYSSFKSSFQKALKSHGDISPDTKTSQIVAAYLVKLDQVCKSMDSPELQYTSHVERLADQLGPVKPEHFTLLEEQYEIFVDTLHSYLEFLTNRNHYTSKSGKSLVLSLREKANNLMANSSYAQSIQIYTNAIDYAQGDTLNQVPQLLVNRAIAYIGLNCFVEAIGDLNHAIALDRTCTPAWIQLGYAQLYMGNSLVAFRCYITAFACLAGRVVPYGFPSEPHLSQDYKDNCLLSILPQFVYQLLKSVRLVEQRATQQRFSVIEINKVRAYLIDILDEIKEHMPEEEKKCCDYPPVDPNDASFRTLAERVNSSRPAILTHEVSQNILAGGGESGVRAGPMIAVETVRQSPPSLQVNATAPSATAAAATPQNAEAAPANPAPSFGGVRNLLNSIGETMVAAQAAHATGTPPNAPRDSPTATNEPTNPGPSFNRAGTTNTNIEETPLSANERVRLALGDVLPDFLSQGLSNVISQSFRGNGGTGEFVFASGLNNQAPPQNAPRSDSRTPRDQTPSSRDLDEEMPPPGLD